jgi:hypothetical protein
MMSLLPVRARKRRGEPGERRRTDLTNPYAENWMLSTWMPHTGGLHGGWLCDAGCKDFGAFNVEQLQTLALIFLRWNGAAFNLYLAFFGFCCMLVGTIVYRSTFLPRILGVLEFAAGFGYATYLWPPLANSLYPWNLALGVGELALGLWLLVFAVNAERWKEQARATRELESGRA